MTAVIHIVYKYICRKGLFQRLTECAFERGSEFLRVDIVFNRTIFGNRDASRLLRHYDHDRIGDFAQTDGGTMARTVGFGHVALCYRQDALGGDYAVVIDYYRAIVQRCILEKDIFQQRYRHFGIEGDTALDDELQVIFLLDDNQRARLRLTHIEAGGDNRRGVDVVRFATRRKYACYEIQLLLPHTYHLEEATYFRLENYDYGYHTHTADLTENCRQQLHIERAHHHPYKVDDDDASQNIGCIGTSRCTVKSEEQSRNEDDVDEIDKCKGNEAHTLLSIGRSAQAISSCRQPYPLCRVR